MRHAEKGMEEWAAPAMVVLLALLIRLAVLYEFRQSNPLFESPVVDAWTYDTLARKFARTGQWPESGAFYQPPAYPFFLSLIYRFLGESYFLPRLIQSLIGACTCLWVYLLGRRIGDRRTGLIAGLVTAAYGPLIFFELDLLAPVFIVFWSMLGLLLLSRALDDPHPVTLVLAGSSMGIAVIGWPVMGLFCLFGVALAVWQWRQKARQALGRVAMLLAGMALTILPVTAHNIRHGDWVLVSTNGGINFFIGNNPEWEETVAARPGYPWENIVALPRQLYGSEEVEKKGSSALFYRKSMEFIASDPMTFLKGQALKFYYLMYGYEIMRNTDLYFFKRYSAVLNALIFKVAWLKFPYGLLLPFAAMGLVGSLRDVSGASRLLRAYLFSVTIGILLFFVTARYRVVLVPVLAVYAAMGACRISGDLRKRRFVEAARLGGIVVFFAIVANFDILGSQAKFERPGYRAQAFFILGIVNLEKNHPDLALPWLEKALRVDPNYPDAWIVLGRAKYALGEEEGAIAAMRMAREVAPDYPVPVYYLALIFDRLNRSPVEAASYYREYLELAHRYFESPIFRQERMKHAEKRLEELGE